MTWIHLKENHFIWPYVCTENFLELSSIYILNIKRLIKYLQLQNSKQFLVQGLDPIVQWFFDKIYFEIYLHSNIHCAENLSGVLSGKIHTSWVKDPTIWKLLIIIFSENHCINSYINYYLKYKQPMKKFKIKYILQTLPVNKTWTWTKKKSSLISYGLYIICLVKGEKIKPVWNSEKLTKSCHALKAIAWDTKISG